MAKKTTEEFSKEPNTTKKTGSKSKRDTSKKKTITKPTEKTPASKEVESETQSSTVELSNKETATSAPLGFPVVGLGASAGGLESLEFFFKNMPDNTGMSFVLVVHLDPNHVSILPDLIQKRTKMRVHPIEDGMPLEPNHVYVIPPNKDLALLHGVFLLMEMQQPRGSNLPIDNFFRSLAQDQGANAVCIILSGTGTDGTLGLKAVKGAVGMVMAQDEASAKYEGMPRSAINTGLVDYVLPPDKMPRQLIKYISHARKIDALALSSPEWSMLQPLQKVFVILRSRTEHDFSLYKKNTICRRIERRMHVHQFDSITDYVGYLQKSDREVEILFRELLIGVTNFFRDPQAFQLLQDKVLPNLLTTKPDDQAIRVWVPGCATGEEAYSIAIVLQECMEKLGQHFHVQIFGTDIDENAIDFARTGVYPASIVADVEPTRIRRYFDKENDGQYRVKKLIRETLVFAPQNVIKDPPFTKLDLLCCRNLLIYLGTELQQKLLPLFHYSLKPDGILFLGSSETIGQAVDLFDRVDNKWKIFKRKTTSTSNGLLTFPAQTTPYGLRNPKEPNNIQAAEGLSTLQLVETILRQSETPTSVIINDACDVIYIHGRTGRFLEPAEGKASVNIVEMARPGLKKNLATAIRRVATDKHEVCYKGLKIEHNGGKLLMNLTVKPILENVVMRGLMMVVFEEVAVPIKADKQQSKTTNPKKQAKTVEQLEHELQHTKENLQTTIEELETSNEELKSTNEELQSTNEELQSTNEEMETSKEELQSLNEESATVNAELQARIDELSKTNDDMKNLLDSTNIATIFLDTELRIRRFTPKSTEIVPLTNTDIGRPINHLASALVEVNIAEHGERVLDDLVYREVEVKSRDNQYFIMRVRPYRTITNVIDGVVITFENVTTAVNNQHLLHEKAEKLKLSEERIRLLLENGEDVINLIDVQGRYLEYRGPDHLGLTESITRNKTVLDILEPPLAAEVMNQINTVVETGKPLQIETKVDWQGKPLYFSDYRYPVRGEDGTIIAVGTIGRNITELRQAQRRLHQEQERLCAIGDLVEQGVFELDPNQKVSYTNQSCAAMFGYSAGELLGKQWIEMIHPNEAGRFDSMMEALWRGNPFEGEGKGKHKDGRTIRIHIRARPILIDGAIIGILGTIHSSDLNLG